MNLINKIILGIAIVLYFSPEIIAQETFDKSTKSSIIGFKSYKPNSYLKDGSWYKIAVEKSGVFKIDYDFIKNTVKLNPANLRFDKFGVFGQAMGILPEYNGTSRTDDITEIGIHINDINNNNIWDNGDYIIFYAQGPHVWDYNTTSNKFQHTFNIYTEKATYFISTDRGTGRPLNIETPPSTTNNAITKFDERVFFEEDKQNLLETEIAGGAGSGREWYGTRLDNINPTKEISFNIPDLISSENVFVKASLAGGPIKNSTSFQVKNNGSFLFSKSFNAVSNPGDYPLMANTGTYEGSFNTFSSNINLEFTFSSSSQLARGWVNYIEIHAQRQLKLNGSYTSFRSVQSLTNAVSKYSISNANGNTEIWDITTPSNIKKIQSTLSGSNLTFTRESNILREFVAVNTSSSSFDTPSYIGKVKNQNLHSLANTNSLIITIPEFKPAAEKLAEYHRNTDGMTVTVVMIEDIYNEYSSGQQDLTAIRDFLKMFYDRNPALNEKLKYVLLLGDGSYDYKNILGKNQNIIPTFQSYKSLQSTNSFCTDDYIGFLDDDEGLNMDNNTTANLDLAIGRIPINSLSEANDVVDKIIYYKTNKSTSSWKNELTFVADDEDKNRHFKDAEIVVNLNTIERKDYYNIDKIYLDAYKQENSAGGDRYPDVLDAILRKLFTGAFFINYTGHGGPTNWAQERVFNIQDIRELDNKDKLPLFMTATCDFSPFDDHNIVSAGESLLLNPNGGAIAMLSTTRLVYSYGNLQMNKAVLNFLFEKVNGKMPTVGEILQNAKNQAPSE